MTGEEFPYASAQAFGAALTDRFKRLAAARDLGDFFTFRFEGARALVQGVAGLRIPTEAWLGPRMFERFGVDLVTGVVITGSPEEAEPLLALTIPGLVRPRYRLYPLVDSVADKVMAIVEPHQGVGPVPGSAIWWIWYSSRTPSRSGPTTWPPHWHRSGCAAICLAAASLWCRMRRCGGPGTGRSPRTSRGSRKRRWTRRCRWRSR